MKRLTLALGVLALLFNIAVPALGIDIITAPACFTDLRSPMASTAPAHDASTQGHSRP